MKNKMKLLILLILIVSGVILFNIVSGSGSDSPSTQSDNTETMESTEDSLDGVNPEEKNSLLLKAGLPYEIDPYAITYRFDDNQKEGVTIIVIDKASNIVGSPAIKSTVYDYFKVRGIDANSLNIEYEIL